MPTGSRRLPPRAGLGRGEFRACDLSRVRRATASARSVSAPPVARSRRSSRWERSCRRRRRGPAAPSHAFARPSRAAPRLRRPAARADRLPPHTHIRRAARTSPLESADTRNAVRPKLQLCPTACPTCPQFPTAKPNRVGNHNPKVTGSSSCLRHRGQSPRDCQQEPKSAPRSGSEKCTTGSCR